MEKMRRSTQAEMREYGATRYDQYLDLQDGGRPYHYLQAPYIIPKGINHIGYMFTTWDVLHLEELVCPSKCGCPGNTGKINWGGVKKGKYLDATTLAHIKVKADITPAMSRSRTKVYENLIISLTYPHACFEWLEDCIAFMDDSDITTYFNPYNGKIAKLFPDMPEDMDEDTEHYANYQDKMDTKFSYSDFSPMLDTFSRNMAEMNYKDAKVLLEKMIERLNDISD